MEQNNNVVLSPNEADRPAFSVTTRQAIGVIILSVLIIAGIWFGNSSYLRVNDSSNNQKKLETIDRSSGLEISWTSLPAPSGVSGQSPKVGISAMCVPGTDCSDTVRASEESPAYYSCKQDSQCAYFSGFTGVRTGVEKPISNMPVSVPPQAGRPSGTSGTAGGINPANTPSKPLAVNGASGCFNEENLMESAIDKTSLRRDPSIPCECGIQPPSPIVEGTAGEIDGDTGEVIVPSKFGSHEGTGGNGWVCMKPRPGTDIRTGNFSYPSEIKLGEPFKISLEYENVGIEPCQEIKFEAQLIRTTSGKPIRLGGSGFVSTSYPPFGPGKIQTLNFDSRVIPALDQVGSYSIETAMFCGLPRETHIVNGMGALFIKVGQ